MKKILVTGIVAICWIALSQQQASAWFNTQFGVGLNWSWQSGGNNALWGAWRNGQPPGPEFYQGGYPGHYPSYGAPQYMMPAHGAIQTAEPAYAAPSAAYPAPLQFATYPRPIYYYPTPYYFDR